MDTNNGFNLFEHFRILILSVLILISGLTFFMYSDLMKYRFFEIRSSKAYVPFNIDESIDNQKAVCDINQQISYFYYSHDNPLWEENNKFGLYIYAEEKDFFEIAQNLVNSNDGDWGYVLIPYNVKDYDYDKWKRVFDQLNNKHLIPIIQLWDIDVDDYKRQTKNAAAFLNKFIWPIKYRYISVYNEPNDAAFWYGRVDPREYARILDYTIVSFREENPDFYLLNGAFNVSASTNSTQMDSFDYMKEMNDEIPGIFNKLDGWASHSYPQPNFSGSPYSRGRWSIRAYEEELLYLKDLGVDKYLPVFITETGWAHSDGNPYNGSFPPPETVANYLKVAFEEVWLPDPKVRAVTPFTIKYDPPYDHFSWINKDNVPYIQYEVVKSIDKVSGNPPVLMSETVTYEDCN